MKRLHGRSFRTRLFIAILAASLIPLLICSALLLQVFRIRMTAASQADAEESLNSAQEVLDGLYLDFNAAAAAISMDQTVTDAAKRSVTNSSEVYGRFLDLTTQLHANACVELYDSGGHWLYSTRNLRGGDMAVNWGALYAARRSGESVFMQPDDDVSGAPLLIGAAPLRTRSGDTAGYLVAKFYQSDLDRAFSGAADSSEDILLLSAYWRGIYCTQDALLEPMSEALRARLLSGGDLNSYDAEFSYTVGHSEGTGLYIVLSQPRLFTTSTMRLLYTVSISCALICLTISIFMSFTLSRELFRPVKRLHSAIEEVASHNNLDVYVQPEHKDELGELAERFNEMLIALKHNQAELVENQRELNEAQIRMLQAQLNPHFLCNTLDTMKWFGKINRVPQVAVMATDLADILRFCVSPEEFVPLRRELELISRYVEIQRIRMSGAFTYLVNVPEPLLGCLVPKMMLQPIVENALLHGLEETPDGVVEVTAAATDGVLAISVTDNGCGIPPELEGEYLRRDAERSRGHLGLYNVDTILRKYYGDGFGLRLENRTDGSGTRVTATLPLRYEGESQC